MPKAKAIYTSNNGINHSEPSNSFSRFTKSNLRTDYSTKTLFTIIRTFLGKKEKKTLPFHDLQSQINYKPKFPTYKFHKPCKYLKNNRECGQNACHHVASRTNTGCKHGIMYILHFFGKMRSDTTLDCTVVNKKFYHQRRMEETIQQPILLSIYFRVALMLSAAASSAPKHA